MNKGRYQEFRDALASSVLVLDGSLGVQIGRMLATGGGNVDFLNITSPDTVARVHHDYLAAGADIIETNTFNSNRLSQSVYALQDRVRELNIRGAEIAREQAAAFERNDPERMRFVSGSIGPTAASASLPNNVDNAAERAVDFDTLLNDAAEQAGALIDGGVDLLLLETCFDALNIKAQLSGIQDAMTERNLDVPVIVSMTLSDASGRLLSGHTPEAVLTIIENFNPAAVGFNCGAGPDSLIPHLRRLASTSPYPVIFYPNAGLPDRLGNYSQTAESFSEAIKPLLDEGLLNIVGGCCGTDPSHISAVSGLVKSAPVHRPSCDALPWLAGMEEFHDNRGFINVGEHCNVAGSRKFLRLIKEGNADEALAIARKQVNDGAMALDINVDDGMLDSVQEMVKFLRLLGSDPLTSSVPWMIDSSQFAVIDAALRNVPGKPIINSISLKHGEQQFLDEARRIHSYGAAVVVMAFDEEGQADTYQRRIDVCRRAYSLLTEKVGFAPRDIIFDPNVLTVATGMPEHDRYALDFIEAVRWIKQNLPGAKTSGGISNLSFAFRGNNFVRQSMHAAFLYHAIEAGMDMAIMDPGDKVTYNDIPTELLEAIEDVILARRPDATQRLSAIAGDYAKDAVKSPEAIPPEIPEDVDERLCRSLMSGDDAEANRIKSHHQALRDTHASQVTNTLVNTHLTETDWSKEVLPKPAIDELTIMKDIPVSEVRPFINWIYFHHCWRTPAETQEGNSLRSEAEGLLDSLVADNAKMWAMVHILPAYGDPEHNRIVVNGVAINTPRQTPKASRSELLSLSDFVAPEGFGDHAGVFMVTIGDLLRQRLNEPSDEYSHLLMQSLCDRLAEAASEWLHYRVRTSIWGYSPDEPLDPDAISHVRYRGIRPAIGYPSLPDQLQMHHLAELIDPSLIDVHVTSNGALSPSSSVAGFYLASPHARYFTL